MCPVRTTDELIESDRRHLWHPFTQQQSWCEDEPLLIDRADGTNLYDADGNAYIDGVSSLWCNVHGHRHPAIDEAIRAQLDRVATTAERGMARAAQLGALEATLIAAVPSAAGYVLLITSGAASLRTEVLEDRVDGLLYAIATAASVPVLNAPGSPRLGRAVMCNR